MKRRSLTFFAATLAFAAASAQAQGDLAGVTMRVLDDVSDIDAVVLELDASGGEDEDGAERGGSGDEPVTEGDAAETSDADAEEDRLDERRAGDELHDPDADERGEGRLEDRDRGRAPCPESRRSARARVPRRSATARAPPAGCP